DAAAENHGVLLPRFVAEVLNEHRDRDRPAALFTRDGRAIWSTAATPPPRAAGFTTIDHVRFLYTPARLGATDCVIAVGQSLAAQEEMLADLRKSMLLTIPLALPIASAGGSPLARTRLTPAPRRRA